MPAFITILIGILQDLFENYVASKASKWWHNNFVRRLHKKWKTHRAKKRKAKVKHKKKK